MLEGVDVGVGEYDPSPVEGLQTTHGGDGTFSMTSETWTASPASLLSRRRQMIQSCGKDFRFKDIL